MGISIINDVGINLDHALIISNIELGLEKFEICRGDIHPSLDTNVIKGLDNRMQAKLLESIQKAVNDLTKDFMDIIANIWTLLKSLELKVINDTKACISVEDQVLGRLIQRTMQDAETLNCASEQFFTLVNDVCQSVDLARKVPIIPSYRNKVKNWPYCI
jgi:hypothetical protein